MIHTIINARDASVSINSEGFDMDGQRAGRNMSFSVASTSFNAADATVKLQHSNTNVSADFQDVTDGSITIATGTALQNLTPITNLGMRFYRIVYTKVSNTAGTITVILNIQ